MANTDQQNSVLMWRYFTRELFIKCNICNRLYKSNNIQPNIHFLKKHLKRKHSYIVQEMKKEIKSTWLSRYFAFDLKCESIRCIFCEKDIEILDEDYIHHMLDHNIDEHTINCLKTDGTMILNLSREIYVKIIQKILDEISSIGLSLYFIYDTLRYGYTKLKCALCCRQFNILVDKQILKDHLSLVQIHKEITKHVTIISYRKHRKY